MADRAVRARRIFAEPLILTLCLVAAVGVIMLIDLTLPDAVRNNATGRYDDVRHGSSFIVMASLTGAKCPDVKTILTYSQAATNANSPHYADQTELFSDEGWVNDRFCASQQKKSPGLRVTRLNGGAKAVKNGW